MKNYKSVFVILILLGLAASFRSINISKDISGDESLTMEIARNTTPQLIQALKEKDIYPPLTYMAIHYWLKIDSSTVWIRVYFILFGVGTCIAIYLIAKEYIDKKVAFIALSLASVSPLLIFASQYIRSYGDSAFWMLLTVLFMLKILKGKDNPANWAAYIASAILSLYTFYFSALLIFSQLLFLTILYLKETRKLFRWYLAFFVIGLFLIPWLPFAARQLANGSSFYYDWSAKGLSVGPFKVGLYTRNVFSIIGFDPFFMIFQGGIVKYFSKATLALAVFVSFCGGVVFLHYCSRYLVERFSGAKKFVLFLPCMIFIPLALSWTASVAGKVLPNARYLIASHSLFLILIAIFILQFGEKKRVLRNLSFVLFLLVFMMRIPQAVSPDIDYKNSRLFAQSELSEKKCLVYMLGYPEQGEMKHLINVYKYLKLNNAKSGYLELSLAAREELGKKIASFEEVIFYKVYGNVEVFGANAIIDKFLRDEGYVERKKKSFNNVDVINYAKKGA